MGEERADGEEGGVGGEDDEFAAWGDGAEGASEGGGGVAADGECGGREAGVLEAEGEVGGAAAADGEGLDVGGLGFPVGVPDPGDVFAVGCAVVEEDEEAVAVAGALEGAEGLVHAGGVLAEQDADVAVVGAEAFLASEGGPVALEGAGDRGGGDCQGVGGGGGGEGVVDAVEALGGEFDRLGGLAEFEGEGDAVGVFGDCGGGDGGGGAGRAAVGAPVAEVCEEAAVVAEVLAAAGVPDGVERVAFGGVGGGVLEAEAEDGAGGGAGEGVEQRVVGIDQIIAALREPQPALRGP